MRTVPGPPHDNGPRLGRNSTLLYPSLMTPTVAPSRSRSANRVTAETANGTAVGSLTPVRLVDRGGATHQVYDIIRSAIVNMTLAPGLAMSEAEIAKQMGVSRTPVRESFRRLAAEGLLQVVPQVGTVVTKMSLQDLMDALFIREAIECGAARRAVHAPLADRKALHELVRRQRAAVDRGDVEEGLRKDEDLHRGLILLSGHPGAWESVRQARAHMERVRRVAIPQLQSNTKAAEQHERIATALVAGNARELVAELQGHIRLIEGFVDGIAERFPQYFEQ